MKALGKSAIKEMVRRVLNESMPNESEFYSGEDDSEIDAIIESKALEAVRFVHGNAIVDLLDADTVQTDAAAASANVVPICAQASAKYVIVELTDYLRLVRVQLKGWKKWFTDENLSTEDEYMMQGDKYTCGTAERPKAFLIKKNNAYQLELYSTEDATPKYTVEYVKDQKAWTTVTTTDDDATSRTEQGVNVSDKLVDAFAYYLAGLVLFVHNDQRADGMFNLATTLMGVQAQKD